jgi:DNA-binding beta-propeller fold protein YncE
VADQTGAGAVAPVRKAPAKPAHELGFVTLLTGKVAVFDLQAMQYKGSFGTGHSHTHGVGVMPGQKVVWYPNRDDSGLDRYERVADDPGQWKLVRKVAAPDAFHFADVSSNGATMALTPDSFSLHGGAGKSKANNVLFFDTASEQFAAPMQFNEPSMVALTADGATAFVIDNQPGQSVIAVVDVAQQTTKAKWLPQASGDLHGGAGHMDVSPDDKTVAVGLFMNKSVALIDVDQPATSRIVPVSNLAFWIAFSPDSKSAYVVTMAAISKEGEEQANAKIATTLERIDVAAGKVVAKTKWKYAFAHCGAPPSGARVFATASFGMVLAFDAQNLELTGELPLMPGLATPAMTVSF